MADVSINGTTYVGELKRPWPEDPERGSSRQGSTLQCIPGILGSNIVAGKRIHVDIGHDDSFGGVEVVLPYVPESDLIPMLTDYHSDNPTTVTYKDARGNTWECVYAPETRAVDFSPHPGFDDRTSLGAIEPHEALYRVVVRLSFIQKTGSGTLP